MITYLDKIVYIMNHFLLFQQKSSRLLYKINKKFFLKYGECYDKNRQDDTKEGLFSPSHFIFNILFWTSYGSLPKIFLPLFPW